MSNKKRIQISVSDENLKKMEAVYEKYGFNKSMQIQTLIHKYLETEYGAIEVREGESHDK